MTEIIGVRYKSGGKQYYFDPRGTQVPVGTGVIVQTARGLEFGECTLANAEVEDEQVVQPLQPMVRIADDTDLDVIARNRQKEARAMQVCQEKIQQHGLDMKLVDVDYSFEGNKILFFFTSDARVDFRALVKDLAGTFRARIELRQIGVRDEAKMLGGLGICGQPFCCSAFLNEFQPVSIKMAKTQNLSLNPTKISGTCGRLMCCLKYEQEAYEDLVKKSPKMDSFVETPDGAGTVSGVNLLREQVKVRLESAPETPKCYHNCEICVIRSGKGKRPEDYVQPPLEELEKRRYVPEKEERKLTSAEPKSRLSEALEAVLSGSAPNAERPEGKRQNNFRRRQRDSRPQGQERQPSADGGQQAKQQPRQQNKRPPRPSKNANGEKLPRPQTQSGGEGAENQERKQGGFRRKHRRHHRPGQSNAPQSGE